MDSFGNLLKSEREKRGVSIDEISKATKINPRILFCLENDLVDELPAMPFVKGFIRNYAKYLGLNPQEFVYRYINFISQHHIPSFDDVTKSEGHESGKISFTQNKILVRAKEINKNRILLALLLLGILFIGYCLSRSITNRRLSVTKPDISSKYSRKKIITPEKKIANKKDSIVHKNPIKPDEPKPIYKSKSIHEPAPQSIETPIPSATKDKEIEPDTQPIIMEPKTKEMVIKVSDITWLDIGIDDNPHYDLIIKPGEVLKLKAKKNFSLIIGNAGGVEITYDGSPLGPLGKKGEVKRLNLDVDF